MSYINESCGCSGGSNSDVINNSPILSGSQEAAFSPMTDSYSFLDGINDVNNLSGNNNTNNILGNNQNNFSNNDDSKQNYSLDDLISMSKENNTSDENKFSNNNIQQMNNNQYNHPTQATSNMLGNSMNTGMNNGMNNMNSMNNGMNQMPDPGMMRNMPTNVNPELQMVMNKLAQANQSKLNKVPEEPVVDRESAGRFILKNFNIVLIVIIGLAWSDVAKFYINRSIKFGGGNHKYYIYYALIMTVILYGTSKYLHMMN